MKTAAALSISVLLGLLVAAPWLRAEAGDDEAALERGRAHIEKTCQRCHAGAQLDTLVRRKAGDRELRAALDGFLAAHHAADPALRADVLLALERRLADAASN